MSASVLPFFQQQGWLETLQLKPGEEKHFSFNLSGGKDYFTCHSKAVQMQAGIGSSALLMCTISRREERGSTSVSEQYEEFIHLAAHDLDAPLRKLNVLFERLAAKMQAGADSTEFMPRIEANIKDMRAMIDGLATLSRFSGLGDTVFIDPGKIINDIVAVFRKTYPEKNIMLEMDTIPLLQGEVAAYQELFHQLIQNAVIFSGNDPVFISVLAEETGENEKAALQLQTGTKFYKITVRDKGIGFRQEDAGKIFQPFVRLHGKSAYPGSGLGLAICKKIVENHGGRIYGEGAENEGARFILFLPQSLN